MGERSVGTIERYIVNSIGLYIYIKKKRGTKKETFHSRKSRQSHKPKNRRHRDQKFYHKLCIFHILSK